MYLYLLLCHKKANPFAFSDKRILYNQKVFVILRAIVDLNLRSLMSFANKW